MRILFRLGKNDYLLLVISFRKSRPFLSIRIFAMDIIWFWAWVILSYSQKLGISIFIGDCDNYYRIIENNCRFHVLFLWFMCRASGNIIKDTLILLHFWKNKVAVLMYNEYSMPVFAINGHHVPFLAILFAIFWHLTWYYLSRGYWTDFHVGYFQRNIHSYRKSNAYFIHHTQSYWCLPRNYRKLWGASPAASEMFSIRFSYNLQHTLDLVVHSRSV